MGKIYGYIRVSTDSQNTEVQRFEIEHYCKLGGLEVDDWFDETISGTKEIYQRDLDKLLNIAGEGDTIICTEVSRLGRSMQIISDVMKICIDKKICIHTLKENYSLYNNDPMTKLILQIYGYAAETERNLISERTKEGLEGAKRKGKTLGRPVGRKSSHYKMDDYRDALIIGLAQGKMKTHLAKKFKVNVCTIHEYIKKWDVYNDVEEYKLAGCPKKWKKYN